jgi:hypothetical protein
MMMPLSILKLGPKSCVFLRSLFPLPSRQTLQTILNALLCRTHINVHVFSTLKCTLQTSDEEHVFCVMFDEMSEETCVPSISLAVLWVCEDLGNHSRTSNIANHVLVFMLCSLYYKWKEPVA